MVSILKEDDRALHLKLLFYGPPFCVLPQEHAIVMAATEKTKEILESIDRLVAEEQNKERLAEIQVGGI